MVQIRPCSGRISTNSGPSSTKGQFTISAEFPHGAVESGPISVEICHNCSTVGQNWLKSQLKYNRPWCNQGRLWPAVTSPRLCEIKIRFTPSSSGFVVKRQCDKPMWGKQWAKLSNKSAPTSRIGSRDLRDVAKRSRSTRVVVIACVAMPAALYKPVVARIIKLPRSCAKVARHTSRKITPDDPAQEPPLSKNCATIFEHLLG